MTIITVKLKPKAVKQRLIQLRCNEDLFKKIKSAVPKDKSVSMHQILISILESTFNSPLKIKIEESVNDEKRSPNNDQS